MVVTLYAAYMSFKALHSKEAIAIKKWVTFWAIFALWQQAYSTAELLLLGYLPFWYLAKCVTLVLLVKDEAACAETVFQKLLPAFNDVEPRVQLALDTSRDLLKAKLESLKTNAVDTVATAKAAAADAKAAAAKPAPAPPPHREAPEVD